MRVIIRFSLDNDPGTRLRNRLHGILWRAGLRQHGATATWEADIGKNDVQQAMGNFWTEINDFGGTGRLDHFWMYTDKTALDDIAPHDGSSDEGKAGE